MDNLQRFGNVMNGRMKKTSNAAVPVTVELGTINGNMSLSTDSLMTPIPKGSYMIDIRLGCTTYKTSDEEHTHSGGTHGGHSGGSGTHTHNGGEHNHRLPQEFRALKAGDRVMVVWCGHEPVVTAIVTSS